MTERAQVLAALFLVVVMPGVAGVLAHLLGVEVAS